MAAIPANIIYTFTLQDNRGYRSLTQVRGFTADVSAIATAVSVIYTLAAGMVTSIAAMTNAKIVKVSFAFDFDYAQEPATETGTYQLVIQKARLRGGDGNGGSMTIEIPAPKDTLFLSSGTDNLIVVNPASTLVTGFQTSTASVSTPRGGIAFSQFFGGQLVQGKPRTRRVVQGA